MAAMQKYLVRFLVRGRNEKHASQRPLGDI
jgi:hypothetical protein